MGGRVGIVSSSEVSVVGSDDWMKCKGLVATKGEHNWTEKLTGVLGSLLDVLSVPLTDARSTSVGKDNTTSSLEGLNHTVSGNGSSDLLGSRGDGELGLGLESVGSSLISDGSGSGHVLIRRIGAGSNKSDLELRGPGVGSHSLGELGDRGGKIGSVGSVDVGLKLGKVL